MLSVELSELEKPLLPKLRDVPSLVLSQIADQMIDRDVPPRILDLLFAAGAGERVAGHDIGESLKRGIIRVRFFNGEKTQTNKAILGGVTANGMKGGLLWIEGDVERICNIEGGIVFVKGNVNELVNVHSKAVIICTGRIGVHLYRSTVGPSNYIYCSCAPMNSASSPVDKWKERPDSSTGVSFVKVNESDGGLYRLQEEKNLEEKFKACIESIASLLDVGFVPKEHLEILLGKLGISL